MTTWDTLCVIGVVAGCTFLTRVLPFLMFKDTKKIPSSILYLGRVLPMAIMFCLVLYCVRTTVFLKYPYGIPEVLGILIVAALHIYKRNNIISIIGGTLCYMVMVQFIFA